VHIISIFPSDAKKNEEKCKENKTNLEEVYLCLVKQIQVKFGIRDAKFL